MVRVGIGLGISKTKGAEMQPTCNHTILEKAGGENETSIDC